MPQSKFRILITTGRVLALTCSLPVISSSDEITSSVRLTSSEIVARIDAISSLEQIVSVKNKHFPYCDEIEDPPTGEYSCHARNVWKPIGQTEDEDKVLSKKGKKELTSNDYDHWRSIESPVLSSNGNWVIYTLTSPPGDGTLVARSAIDDVEWQVSRGKVRRGSPASTTVSAGREVPEVTPDSRYVMFTIAEKALRTLDLKTGIVTRIPNVTSFKLSQGSGNYIACVLDGASQAGSQIPGQHASSDTHAGERVSTLMLYGLRTGSQRVIQRVSEYLFDDQGQYLAYATRTASDASAGVYLLRLKDGYVSPLLIGSGDYRGLTFDRAGKQIAFLFGKENHGQEGHLYSVYYAKAPFAAARLLVGPSSLGAGSIISPGRPVNFTRTGNAVTFGIRTARISNRGTSPRTVEVWHWQDPWIQPLQKLIASRRDDSHLAVYRLTDGTFAQLEGGYASVALLTDDAAYAVGIDTRPYKIQQTWGVYTADLYLFDISSGERRLLQRGFQSNRWLEFQPTSRIRLSPSGKYVLYFANRRWFSYDLRRSKLVDLTSGLLPQIEFDVKYSYARGGRGPTAPVGIAGWTAEDRRVLIYDQHDIWEIDPSGKRSPRNLTDGIGRKKGIVFRVRRPGDNPPWFLEAEENEPGDSVLLASRPLLLAARNAETMATGFWHDWIDRETQPKPLLMMNSKVRLVAEAEPNATYLVTQEKFDEFPDLWWGRDFSRLHRVSAANPQQRVYKWGKAELVEWTSSFGAQVKGVLYKPDNFDSNKKYPMVVEVYGINSVDLHAYFPPKASHAASISSIPGYLAKDVLIFMPDIALVPTVPIQSMVAAVIPGVRSLISRSFVDESRIGLLGHSMGGFETISILTATDLFRCAVEGAGMSDPIASYSDGEVGGAQYFESGAFGYGASIWEDPLVYIDNSPLMRADRITSPLLILHNDSDVVVPFSEGVALYYALRRNGEEAYLVNYPNEGHGLSNHNNRLDWERRMMQFFEHFLLNAARPEWMKAGR